MGFLRSVFGRSDGRRPVEPAAVPPDDVAVVAGHAAAISPTGPVHAIADRLGCVPALAQAGGRWVPVDPDGTSLTGPFLVHRPVGRRVRRRIGWPRRRVLTRHGIGVMAFLLGFFGVPAALIWTMASQGSVLLFLGLLLPACGFLGVGLGLAEDDNVLGHPLVRPVGGPVARGWVATDSLKVVEDDLRPVVLAASCLWMSADPDEADVVGVLPQAIWDLVTACAEDAAVEELSRAASTRTERAWARAAVEQTRQAREHRIAAFAAMAATVAERLADRRDAGIDPARIDAYRSAIDRVRNDHLTETFHDAAERSRQVAAARNELDDLDSTLQKPDSPRAHLAGWDEVGRLERGHAN